MQAGIRSRVFRVCAAGAVVAALWSGADVALADGMILPWTLGTGYLNVRYHHVTVEIVDGYAVTRVEQEFHNPQDFEVQGQYLFPVPPGAMLSSFQATVDGEVRQVVRQDADTTNQVLHRAVAYQLDPSLLQYVDWESFAFDVTLGPDESCRMVLEYDEMLMPIGGMLKYRYVLSTERYSFLPQEEVSLTVDVRSSAGLATVYSPSHDVLVEHLDAERARATWSAEDASPTEDFVLYFSPADRGFGSGLLTGRHDDQDYFLFLFAPDSEIAQEDVIPKDIVFVIDRSGSMHGRKIEQAQEALRFILGQMGDADRFSIVSFNDLRSQLFDALQPVNTETLAEARRFVDRMDAGGSTDLETALQSGLNILERSEARQAARLVVFLTDGLPTAGTTDAARIAASIEEANAEIESRIHVFGVGYDVNTHLLDRLASESSGTVTYVSPDHNLEEVLTAFYSEISQPVLTDIEISYSGITVEDLHPGSPPDLFEGSALLIAGRYEASSNAIGVQVRGRVGDETHVHVYKFDLEQTGSHDFVPRVWATRQIGALLDSVRVDGETEDLVAEIKDLGLEFGLVTPYTTFVVAGQADGAASAANMGLYADTEELGWVSGRTTVLARVQNQVYQDAWQAGLAQGANVVSFNGNAVAQLGSNQSGSARTTDLSIDLSLLQGQEPAGQVIDVEWIADNVGIDRVVAFGSEEYFALAQDPTARSFLQAGVNTVFSLGEEVIQIAAADDEAVESGDGPSSSSGVSTDVEPSQYAAIDQRANPETVARAPQKTAKSRALPEPSSAFYILAIVVLAAAALAAVAVAVLVRRRLMV